MTPAWAVRIAIGHAGLLGPLRCDPGLSVLAQGDALWLRGEDPATLGALEVRRLPADGRYTVREGGGLVPVGLALPVGTLPTGEWVALSRWMQVAAPRAQFAGRSDIRITLALARSASERQANLLISTLHAVRRWAEDASRLRLRPLSVAVDRGAGRAALRGVPLPPLPGERYTVEAGVALPGGFGFALPLTREEAAQVVGLPKDHLALFAPDGSWTPLPEDCFIAATRATLRRLGTPTRDAGVEGASC